MTMKAVKAVTDESGHWYVLPNELHEDFLRDSENEDFVDSGGFDEKYGDYKTGGDLNNIQLYVGPKKVTVNVQEKKMAALLKEAMKLIDHASMFGLDREEAGEWYTKTFKYLEKYGSKRNTNNKGRRNS